jgi:hypothetical protein
MNWLDPITIILAGIGLGALACQLIIRLVDSYSGTDQKKTEIADGTDHSQLPRR